MYRVIIEAGKFPVSAPLEKSEAVRIAALLSQCGQRHAIAKV